MEISKIATARARKRWERVFWWQAISEFAPRAPTIPDLGSGRVWGGIVIVTFMKSATQELRRIILLHFGRVTFRFHFGKARTVIMFTIFGFLDMSKALKNQFFLILGPLKDFKRCRNIPNHLWKILLLETLKFWKSSFFSGEDACCNILKICLIRSWKAWVWNQYLSKSRTWQIGKIRSISAKKRENGSW